jgi:hypothetical protein
MQQRFRFTRFRSLAIVILLSLVALSLAGAAVMAAEQSEGWRPLFNGKDFSGWTNAAGKAPGRGWVAAEGAMFRKDSAGDIWTKERFGSFVLDLEFKTEGNSGIFIRTGNPGDCVQTGIEIQVYKPVGKPSKHSCGAVYDAVAPTKDMVKADAWNHVVITANDNRLEVVMNGEKIIDMDLDRWTTLGQNPDGTKNKYHKALKDFPREGHIGLQDHGAKVSYRNVKIRGLDAK